MTVVAELLGLPAADRALFRSWADRLFDQQVTDPNDPDLARKVDDATADMLVYLHGHCRDRRAQPRQDLISELASVQLEGEQLTDEEVVTFSMVLLFAGHITTTALLGNTVLCLDERPDVLAEVHADPALIPAAIEEVLRYRSSFTQVARVTMARPRRASAPILRPPLLYYHCLQLADMSQQPLDDCLQRPGTRYTKITSSYHLSAGSDPPRPATAQQVHHKSHSRLQQTQVTVLLTRSGIAARLRISAVLFGLLGIS